MCVCVSGLFAVQVKIQAKGKILDTNFLTLSLNVSGRKIVVGMKAVCVCVVDNSLQFHLGVKGSFFPDLIYFCRKRHSFM